jgi:hypothetical protein
MSTRTLPLVIAIAIAVATLPVRSAHAELPATFQVPGAKLVLNGVGTRTKYLMRMYNAGLYLPQPSKDAPAIVAANSPMAIRLQITSGMVTQEKLVESLNEGFEKSTGGKTEVIRAQIDDFRKVLAVEIAKGDVIDLVYLPDPGVVVAKNGKKLGVVQGIAFKRALFGIWLSDNPADAGLKKALLVARAPSTDAGPK